MDIQQIELRYNSELAVLKNQKANLSKRLSEIQSSLGLSDDEFTSDKIELMIEDATKELTSLENELSTLINEFEKL